MVTAAGCSGIEHLRVGVEHLKSRGMDGSQTRCSKGGSGDLDMTRMEWELLAFNTSWELDFCFDRGEGRHFFPS